MHFFEAHPFKEAVRLMLKKQFGDEIANSFKLSFEAELISSKDSPHIFNQLKDGNLVMEVRYMNPDGIHEYICDLYSWEQPRKVEAKLLRFIADKYKAGKIRDWEEGSGIISKTKAGALAKYETPDSHITSAMIQTAIARKQKEGELPN